MGSDGGSWGRAVSRGTGEPAKAGPRRASCVSEHGDRPAEGAVSKSPSPAAGGGPAGDKAWGEAWHTGKDLVGRGGEQAAQGS